ncbi:MAG: sialate O-acetylesterase [bacterium]|nr:sialate O-acetylesterase [bacterium]
MFQKKWFKWLIGIVLFLSLLLNAFIIREIVVFKPFGFTKRSNKRIKQLGIFNNKVDLKELKSDSTIFILALGQSNAANSGGEYYTVRHNVLNFYEGTLYKAEEPLIGASGDGGCVWTMLADKLIDSGWCKKVVIITIAQDGSTMDRWANGDLNIKLKNTLTDLNAHQIQPTWVFWHQGESDNGYSHKNYKRDLFKVVADIKAANIKAPFYCSVATYCIGVLDKQPHGLDFELQAIQRDFIKSNANVLEGPFTDSLIYAFQRHDTQHFSYYGNQQYAQLWFNALKNKIE